MKRIWIAAAAAATLLLAGCAGGGAVSQETFTGLPEGVTDSPGETFATWVDESNFAIVTYGSSSTDCIPVATKLTEVDPSTLDVVFETKSDGPCTMDFSPATHVFTAPDGLETGSTVTLNVTIDDAKTTLELAPN